MPPQIRWSIIQRKSNNPEKIHSVTLQLYAFSALCFQAETLAESLVQSHSAIICTIGFQPVDDLVLHMHRCSSKGAIAIMMTKGRFINKIAIFDNDPKRTK